VPAPIPASPERAGRLVETLWPSLVPALIGLLLGACGLLDFVSNPADQLEFTAWAEFRLDTLDYGLVIENRQSEDVELTPDGACTVLFVPRVYDVPDAGGSCVGTESDGRGLVPVPWGSLSPSRERGSTLTFNGCRLPECSEIRSRMGSIASRWRRGS